MTAAKKIVDKTMQFYTNHERSLATTFFAGGIGFDIVTLGRIDDLFNLLQQALFIALAGYIIALEIRHIYSPERIPKWIAKYFEYRELGIHFLFGALLSAYSIFYFKSSSSFTLLFFFLPLCLLLIVNEMPRFQKMGVPLHIALLSLCTISYLTYLIPILLRSISTIFFLLAWLLSGVAFYFFIRRFWKKVETKYLIKRMALPTTTVHVAFLALYLGNIIPPVPIAVDHMGIYHDVQKMEDRYKLVYTRPSWKFWQRGDQDFAAQPNDKLYCYFRIFSPAAFQDRVNIHWMFFNSRNKWETADKIPVDIVGGREQGFRGYTYKQNYHPGKWRVLVESLDGREIGRLNFEVAAVDANPERVLKQQYD